MGLLKHYEKFMKITLLLLTILISVLFHTSLTTSGNAAEDKKDHDEKKAVPSAVLSTATSSSTTTQTLNLPSGDKQSKKPLTKTPVNQPTTPSDIFEDGVHY